MWNVTKSAPVALGIALLAAFGCNAAPASGAPIKALRSRADGSSLKISPQVFIISMFAPEGEVWQSIPEFDILAQNITVPGFSPLFPSAHCTSEGTICQLVTGEAEINAASTISALAHSPFFDLTKTYFLIAGIAGVNPKVATVGSVTFARYAIQVALQYEIDAREKPDNFSTGYIPQGSFAPDQYPLSIYGTEVFEVNDALRQVALGFTSNVTLNDSTTAQETPSGNF